MKRKTGMKIGMKIGMRNNAIPLQNNVPARGSGPGRFIFR